MSHLAYLSLGSNLGDRVRNLRTAIARLASYGNLTASSSFYETEPVEFVNQPWFLNCAVGLKTEHTGPELMSLVLQIEREMGRERVEAKGPRTIDIDILLFDQDVVNSAELTIPHPALHQRRFVLVPLAEIAPEARHPVLGNSVRELLQELRPGQEVCKLPSSER